MSNAAIADLFVARSRHLLSVEYPTKIRRCLAVLPERATWQRADEGSNTIGNLLLHLAGNIRQWIACGVGGAVSSRDRAAEFAAHEGADASVLLNNLTLQIAEAVDIIGALEPARLPERIVVQGRDVTVLDAIYHVVEHCALHTGQIILLTKQLAPGAISFYEDAGGRAIPRWQE